jgi:hypothetical protein
MSDGVLLASVIINDFRGGFSIVCSTDLVSNDRRCAATFPKMPLLRSELIILFVESFNESFEPKLSFLFDCVVVVVIVPDVDFKFELAVMIVFVLIGGRSLTGDAKNRNFYLEINI